MRIQQWDEDVRFQMTGTRQPGKMAEGWWNIVPKLLCCGWSGWMACTTHWCVSWLIFLALLARKLVEWFVWKRIKHWWVNSLVCHYIRFTLINPFIYSVYTIANASESTSLHAAITHANESTDLPIASRRAGKPTWFHAVSWYLGESKSLRVATYLAFYTSVYQDDSTYTQTYMSIYKQFV